MKKFEIKGTARQALGKKDTRNLRAQDLVPCVLYGGGNTHSLLCT